MTQTLYGFNRREFCLARGIRDDFLEEVGTDLEHQGWEKQNLAR